MGGCPSGCQSGGPLAIAISERRSDSRDPGTVTTWFGSGGGAGVAGAGSFTTNAQGSTAFAPVRAGPAPADAAPEPAEPAVDPTDTPEAQAAARPARAVARKARVIMTPSVVGREIVSGRLLRRQSG